MKLKRYDIPEHIQRSFIVVNLRKSVQNIQTVFEDENNNFIEINVADNSVTSGSDTHEDILRILS